MPTVKGSCVLIDVGANPAARAEHLAQYGLMGAVFARELLGVKSPRVGLLNIGSEEGKGTDLYRETHALLVNSPIKESLYRQCRRPRRVSRRRRCDYLRRLRRQCRAEGQRRHGRICAEDRRWRSDERAHTERDLAMQTLDELTEQFHYQESGGAPLLGIDGICIICHGSSDHRSIRNALRRWRRNRQPPYQFANHGTAQSAESP